MIEWWDKREENDVAWRVKVGDLKRGFDLDVKNPISTVEERELTVPEPWPYDLAQACSKMIHKLLDISWNRH